MKRLFVAGFLFLLSLSAFADIDTTVLHELSVKMVVQATKIASAFTENKMRTDDGVYQDIWLEEFNISDSLEIVVNTVELYKGLSSKSKDSLVIHALDNLMLTNESCKINLVNLTNSRDSIHNIHLKNEVAKQSDYANQACDGIEKMQKVFLKTLN
ncbi:hypothetical protein [Sulfuriferula nivalis]|uniref:Uncharacterized protein n=1 Tax=Sulfuriferula nivalis TaxID=2675298 RepID=A0A809RJS0_9PROT|nr:hypothetical protein [Sulfuriferula nivalis]BBP01735.1 hypothetical protein SFSGTM_24430 [Sulfuriferula nivalis]